MTVIRVIVIVVTVAGGGTVAVVVVIKGIHVELTFSHQVLSRVCPEVNKSHFNKKWLGLII